MDFFLLLSVLASVYYCWVFIFFIFISFFSSDVQALTRYMLRLHIANRPLC